MYFLNENKSILPTQQTKEKRDKKTNTLFSGLVLLFVISFGVACPSSSNSTGANVVVDVTAPARLTLTAGAATPASITVTWTDPGNNDFSHVLINWTPPGITAGGTVTTTPQGLRVEKGIQRQRATIIGLTPETEYMVTAVSVDTTGNRSESSEAVAVSTTAITTGVMPSALVTGLAGTATGQSITMTWTNPTTAGFANVLLSWEPTGGTPAQPLIITPDSTQGTATIHGLAVGTDYAFTAKSINTNGVQSAATTPAVTVATSATADETAPAAVTLAGTVNGQVATLTWTDPTEADFVRVEISWTPSAAGGTQPVIANKASLTATTGRALIGGLAAGTTYSFTAVSVDASGNKSDPSTAIELEIAQTTEPSKAGL